MFRIILFFLGAALCVAGLFFSGPLMVLGLVMALLGRGAIMGGQKDDEDPDVYKG